MLRICLKSLRHFNKLYNISYRNHVTAVNTDKVGNGIEFGNKNKIIDLLIELNYSKNNKVSLSNKLRLLYTVLHNCQYTGLINTSHIISLILDLWNSRGLMNKSELSLFDKLCHDHSLHVWNHDTNHSNPLSNDLYMSEWRWDWKLLDNEVLCPTAEQFEKKRSLMDHLKPLIESSINGTLHTFGSCDNGLWTRGSDIDMCLVIPNCDSKRYMLSKLNLVSLSTNKLLVQIKSCLSNSDIISKISIISARVPIVKLFDMEENSICDISINNTIALSNSEYVKTMCKLDERVVLLGRFIKYWATSRKINNRAQGTMSSYTLILQLFYFLQNTTPPIIPPFKDIEINDEIEYHFLTDPSDIKLKCDYIGKNEDDVVELLFGFFEFYAQERFNGGKKCSTIDLYTNEVTENVNGSLIVKCPLSKKNVNPFTIKMWQSIYTEFKRANDLIKLKQPLKTVCLENSQSPLEFQSQHFQLNLQKLIQLLL
uniref:Nucleotidyltransferase domain containing protein, putative n=1 Tax=Theileria annulata TaxID=5874 RepID=A0A3B0NE19_THEAN